MSTLRDSSFENCRRPLIDLIRAETAGIDAAWWFMEDSRYPTELVKRFKAGVPVRVLIDPRANSAYPLNAGMLQTIKDAGIPMRRKLDGGILHWKMMMFAAQSTVEFGSANFSGTAFVPRTPYVNYIDETIYFCDDPPIVNSFRTKYDDLWTDTSEYGDYANINGPKVRVYPTHPIDPSLNFPPGPTQDYAQRLRSLINAETQKIDVVMYRHGISALTDALIAAVERGIAVRLLAEPREYKSASKPLNKVNIDRLLAGGVQVSMRVHEGLNHQKSALFYGQGTAVFGSSNWSSASANSQLEHNLFTTQAEVFNWLVAQFERKWNSPTEFAPFTGDM